MPVAGVIAVAFGRSMLPTLFARLAASHYLYVLPYGRIKVLASVFVTLTLVALVVAGTTTVYYVRTPLQLDVVFERAFVVALLTCNLLYTVLWLTGRSSSAIGTLVGSIFMIATLLVPLPFIALPSRSLAAPWAASLLIWGGFAAAFLLAPRWKGRVGRLRQAIAARLTGASYHGGGEVDFLIGTAQPWALALGQVVPLLMASYFLAIRAMAPAASEPVAVLHDGLERPGGRDRELGRDARPQAVAADPLDARAAVQARRGCALAPQQLCARRAARAAGRARLAVVRADRGARVRHGSRGARHRLEHLSRHDDHGADRLARGGARGRGDGATADRRELCVQAARRRRRWSSPSRPRSRGSR